MRILNRGLTVAIAVGFSAFAAPPSSPAMTIEAFDGTGVVNLPTIVPDGGSVGSFRITSTGSAPLEIQSISVVGDDSSVFAIGGVVPITIQQSATYQVHFKPFDAVGTFSGRVVVDYQLNNRDDSLVVCASSSPDADGGRPPRCSVPPRAPSRGAPIPASTPGCTTMPLPVVLAVVLLVGRRR